MSLIDGSSGSSALSVVPDWFASGAGSTRCSSGSGNRKIKFDLIGERAKSLCELITLHRHITGTSVEAALFFTGITEFSTLGLRDGQRTAGERLIGWFGNSHRRSDVESGCRRCNVINNALAHSSTFGFSRPGDTGNEADQFARNYVKPFVKRRDQRRQTSVGISGHVDDCGCGASIEDRAHFGGKGVHLKAS